MLDQHCHLCHGWKSGCDEFCGGDYCLKKEKKQSKEKKAGEMDVSSHSKDESLTEGIGKYGN